MIGVLDWGIGGLSVYQELIRRNPGVSTLYFSDSGSLSYGKLSKKKLLQRLHLVSDFFRRSNVRIILLGCNAASTVIDELQKKNPDLLYYGMLGAGYRTIIQSKTGSVLVLGGKRTVLSRYFQKKIRSTRIKMQAKIAQPLSGLIEKGLHKSKKFDDALKRLFRDLKFRPESVLLACTHYPAATSSFKKHQPQAAILNPAAEVVTEVLSKNKILNSKKPVRLFFTTGSLYQSQQAAQKSFEIRIKTFKKVALK